MFDFVNRFTHSDDDAIIESLNQILGGPGWRDRLDSSLTRGPAVEKNVSGDAQGHWRIQVRCFDED